MEHLPPHPAPAPRAEPRAQAIELLGLLEAEAEREFVTLTELAKRTFGVEVAMYSLIDAHRHWVRASCGLSIAEVPLEHSFCAHVLAADDMLVVEDMALHAGFSANPFVTGGPRVRFYAGAPIRARTGPSPAERVAIGTLCLLDGAPRRFGEEERGVLRNLAGIAEALIDARASAVRAERLAEERRRGLEALEREQRRFKQAERLGDMGSWRVAAEEGLTHWSDGVFAIHELPPGELPTIAEALSHYPPADRTIIEVAVRRAVESGAPFDVEVDFVTAKGNRRRVRVLGEPDVQADGRTGIVGVFQDITARHRMEQSLRRMAGTDDLTQIANRAECNRALDRAIKAARETGAPLALLLIDLDGFKSVNDRCGHLVGDDLLRRVGAALRAPYLAGCFAARLGGDEFVLIVSAPEDCRDLDAIVGRLLADLRHTVTHEAQSIEVSGTVGIAWLDDRVGDRSELMRRADVALYAAKELCRGTAQTFRPAVRRGGS